MPKTLSIAEAREQLTRLPEQLASEPETGAVTVTRRGRPVLAVLSWDLYESILETLEVFSDEGQVAALRRGIKDLSEGKTLPWVSVKETLSL